MGKRIGMEVSIGIAEAVAQADVDVIAAYPITPQTHIVEHLSEIVAEGELDAEYIPVESEHSAMSACCGSSAAGARTFTSSSSQGLALMHEILFIASGMRLPIVMCVVDRALSAPISIWNDHGDIMAQRDTGWVQTFCENGQEAIDHVFHSFRVAEDKDVYLPVMMNIDGFIMSHMVESFEMWDKEQVQKYLPTFKPLFRLDVDKPWTFGPVGIPDIYTETRMAHNEVLKASKQVCIKAWDEIAALTGRQYRPVEHYRTDDAEVVFVTMGAVTETLMTEVDELRQQGKKVGIVRLRLWRPFPAEEILEALSGRKAVAVVDRCLSTGGPGGPVACEVKGALYHAPKRPPIIEFIAGLGGRDIKLGDFKAMYDKAEAVAQGGVIPPYELWGVRA
jgi:pyruvate ferredoxin oxidoreductase alpha subunit